MFKDTNICGPTVEVSIFFFPLRNNISHQLYDTCPVCLPTCAFILTQHTPPCSMLPDIGKYRVQRWRPFFGSRDRPSLQYCCIRNEFLETKVSQRCVGKKASTLSCHAPCAGFTTITWWRIPNIVQPQISPEVLCWAKYCVRVQGSTFLGRVLWAKTSKFQTEVELNHSTSYFLNSSSKMLIWASRFPSLTFVLSMKAALGSLISPFSFRNLSVNFSRGPWQ